MKWIITRREPSGTSFSYVCLNGLKDKFSLLRKFDCDEAFVFIFSIFINLKFKLSR